MPNAAAPAPLLCLPRNIDDWDGRLLAAAVVEFASDRSFAEIWAAIVAHADRLGLGSPT